MPAHGRDLLVLLDVSRSMLAEDAKPNRLERAKADLRVLAGTLERRGGWRIGLIAFADRAALLCPLTTDFKHFHEELTGATLENLRTRRELPGWVDGTQLGVALARAERLVPDAPLSHAGGDGLGVRGDCDLLVISDGGDELAEETLATIEALKTKQARVCTVGVGDPKQEVVIPITLANGQRDFVHYQGRYVGVRLEEKPLRQLAEQTGGTYFAAGTGPLAGNELLATLDTRPGRELNAAGQARDPVHRYEWFLLPAILLLLMEGLVSTRGQAVTEGQRSSWLARLVPPPQRVRKEPLAKV
jgi:Ca-activated chloride channel family protein